MAIGFVYDARFRDHDTGPQHPERPERLDRSLVHLQAAPWWGDLLQLPTRPADVRDLERIHDLAYVRRAALACRQAAPFLDTPDVAISGASYDVAVLAAGAALELADAIVDGRVDKGFALLRPPGHHAEHDTALGFCLFNNVAILTRYLQRIHGLGKIAILDWDVHHGNGTQHSFEADPSVLYISLHQYPYYPGTGAYSETGVGAGSGATLNCPMPAGATDTAYEKAFSEQIVPKLDRFAAEWVIVSAGFDAHRDDPLADIELSTRAYEWMTERVMECADKHSGGRILSVLEGGYHLDRLGECITAHLGTLCGKPGLGTRVQPSADAP